MDGSRVSDFSIESILSAQGTESAAHGYPGTWRFPCGFSSADLGPAAVLVPVPVAVLGCINCGAGFHHGVFRSSADAQPLPCYHGYHGYQQARVFAQPRQKTRMRTVFTDSQIQQLEAKFELTEYPTTEERAAVAGSTGLSEETVRVWFKNRRARRKRQRSGSKVKAPSPPPSGAEEELSTSFL